MFKTFTKITLFLLSLSFMLLSGCSGDSNYRVEGGPLPTAVVTSNGGLVVKKGDFIYFINGISTTSADNTFGKAVKGSIMRMDINNPTDKVIVVPKVVLSSYEDGGFYIFGNKIYYTSPSLEKDKNANILTNYLDYFSVNLDGSGTKKIMTTISNSNPYKFFEKDGNVYVIYIDSSAGKIILVNADNGNKTTILENYTNTPILAQDGYVYYNEAIYKDEEKKTETFTYNRLKRMDFLGGNISEIKLSDDKTITQDKFTVTLTEVKIFDNKTVLFYTKKSATDILDPIIYPEAVSFSFALGEATDELLVASSGETFDFTNRFYNSATSFFGVYSSNLYYVKANDGVLDSVLLMPNPAKILFINNDFIYYLKTVDSNNILYKKQFKGAGAEQNSEGTEVLKDVSFATSGLKAELIDAVDLYFIRTDGDYLNYLYKFNIETGTEAELVSKIAKEDEITK